MYNYWTSDPVVQLIAETYCSGKSKLWNMFFGWRESTCYNETRMRYLVSKKAWENILVTAILIEGTTKRKIERASKK